MSNELDKMAKMLYGPDATFDNVSEFGKRMIRNSAASASINMAHIDLARALQSANDKIAHLEREVKDAWEENEDLKLQLMEQEDASSTSRSGGSRKARTRTVLNESLPNVPPDTVWLSPTTDTDTN